MIDSLTGSSSNKCPKVSVIVPLFNGERYIEICIKSILSQTYKDYEIIVIDDGSSDRGPQIILDLTKEYPKYLRYVSHPDGKNYGIAASRNLGLRHSTGKYIAFIDQDDLWLPEKLALQVPVLERHCDAALVYSKVDFVDEYGENVLLDKYKTAGKGRPRTTKNIFNKLLKENIVLSLTVLVRAECLRDAGCFEEGPRYEYEDWLLWTKLSYFHKFYFLPEVVATYRLHQGSYSVFRRDNQLHLQAEEHLIITLFANLFSLPNVNMRRIRRRLRRSIAYFFFKARAWDATKEDISRFELAFENRFSDESGFIRLMRRIVLVFDPRILCLVRRLRRRIVKV